MKRSATVGGIRGDCWAVTDGTHLEPPLWTIELTLIPSTAATEPEARDALRGIKARRRKGDPLTCCCCPTTLGAAPLVLVLARGNAESIEAAQAGLCRRCAPDVEVASEKAAQIVQAVWPGMAGYDLAPAKSPQ